MSIVSKKCFLKFLHSDGAALEDKVRRWYILRGTGCFDSQFILRSRALDLILGQGYHNWVDPDPLCSAASRWYFMSGAGILMLGNGCLYVWAPMFTLELDPTNLG